MPEAQPQKVFRSQDVSRDPGVYVFRNRLGEVIYVGKARNLRSRMRAYFMPSAAQKSDPRRRALINSIASYETFIVASEAEALLLESRFIKEYNPRYNILLRDDKRYPLICLDQTVPYPRLELARIRRDDQRTYFGPFPQATSLRETLRFLELHYHLRSCDCPDPNLEHSKHCMEHIIRACSSPCRLQISPEDYCRQIAQVVAVLQGGEEARTLMRELDASMREAAANLNFEEAARLRDVIGNLKVITEPTRKFINQTIVSRQARSNPEGVAALQAALTLCHPPLYLECFDMSNISGVLAVGSMVCFRNGKPSTGEYRRFRIRTAEAHDDTAFMREVLHRRYTRLQRDQLPFPNLIVLDGGPGQLQTGMQVMAELGIHQQPMIGLAKQHELLIIPGSGLPLALPRDNPGLKLLQAIRDEAHRFANAYHRQLRNRRLTDSLLDDIPGIGKKRKMQLLQTFGSVRHICGKSADELAAGLPGLGHATAEKILEFLKRHSPRPSAPE